MITIVAEATAKPGHEAAIRAALDACARLSRAEPGNVVYQPLEEVERPGRFLVYEIWRDEAAIAVHNETEHFGALIGTVKPLCDHLAIRRMTAFPAA
ncbi:putative quinol monooxygenase [Methylobacterium sp. 77]|uniref:putative quinol monooxygenase n=1 Tax=Methylobacterium sp. 77 TaxID=1101192 RepID=UPI0003690773|nr:putative quinol monooxygenase [Methylobacterium sp. 77]